MTRESYEYYMSRIQRIPHSVLLLRVLERVLTFGTGLIYLLFLGRLLSMRSFLLLGAGILIPMLSFLAVSFFRYRYNAERPYEIYGFSPLIPKDTKGKSFPSRHVFSIYVIGSTIFWVFPWVGICIFCAGVLMAVFRVVSGVHFPKDVLAGGILGILCGTGMKIVMIFLL